MITPRAFSVKLQKKVQIAKKMWTFYFEYPHKYDFYPGQYNRVALPITARDGRGSTRQFTISSSPLEKGYLTITTKEGISDFKKAFFNLAPGTDVHFFGPLGGFYLREEYKTPRVFLAGGIGVTPFYSMITYAATKMLSIPLTLIVSFSTPEETIFFEEFADIEKNNDNIRIIYTISSPEKSRSVWHGETGRISEAIIKKYIDDVQKSMFMIVGPPPMVDATFELLEQMQIPQENIKVEHFNGY